MDRFIAKMPSEEDGDLMLCRAHGVAWQQDMSSPVEYDDAYFDKYVGYEGKGIAKAINAGRVAIVNRYAGRDAITVDIGIGCGEFIKSRPATFGRDVNPKGIEWLRARNLWAENLRDFDAFTFWDVIEHIEDPISYFRQINVGAYLFTSLPIFGDLTRIRDSKHYRPNEHFYYWTAFGFVSWMQRYGFQLLDQQDFETRAGRDSILSFAFRRDHNEGSRP